MKDTNEQKAKEIADFLYYKLNHIDYNTLKRELLEMARFAEEQNITKACEWLEKNSELYSYRELDEYDMQYYARIDKEEMIINFKKEMEK